MNILVRVLWFGCGAAVSTSVFGADWNAAFAVPVSIGYTDNANLSSDDTKQSESFWRMAPGFTLSTRSPRWNAAVNYAYLYERRSRESQSNESQRLSASTGAELLDNLLYFDANAGITQQRDNVLANVDLDSTRNMQDVYTWSVRPALRRQFANSSTAELAATVRGVHANGSNDSGNGLGRQIRGGVSTGGMFDAVRLGVNAAEDRFRYDDVPANALRDETRNSSAGVHADLTVSSQFIPYADYGYQRILDTRLLNQSTNKFWKVGLIWTPSARTRAEASFGRRFFGETRMASLNHRMRRFSWKLAYTQGIRDGQQDFFNPQALAMASLLDSALLLLIPDEAQRDAEVRRLLQQPGMPPLTVLGNRYYLDRNLVTGLSYATVKSVTGLDLFWRDSDSTRISAPTAVAAPAAAGEHIRQRGATLSWNYRLGARAGVNVSTGVTEEIFPLIEQESRSRFARGGVNYKLGRHVSSSAEIRRVERTTSDASRDYTANSVVLTLTASF